MEINRDFIGCFGKLKKGNKKNIIVIHHTVTNSTKQTRKALKNKGCSTHFEIDRDGVIYQYAELDEIAQHCGSNNFQSIGIDLTHMTGAEFPKEQLESCYKLIGYLSQKLDIPLKCYDGIPKGIYFHRSLGQTECPNNLTKEKLGFFGE